MDHHDGMRLGMFLGGLIMAIVPVVVGVGFYVFLLKAYREERRAALETGERP